MYSNGVSLILIFEVLIINPYAYIAFWSGFESDYQIPTYLIRKYTPNNLSKMDIYLEPSLKLKINIVQYIERPKSGKLKHFYSEIND